MNYPLYDTLWASISDVPNDLDLKELFDTINSIGRNLDREDATAHYLEIGALILHYDLINGKSSLKLDQLDRLTGRSKEIASIIPMGGKALPGNNAFTYTLTVLPLDLVKLLRAYIDRFTDDSDRGPLLS